MLGSDEPGPDRDGGSPVPDAAQPLLLTPSQAARALGVSRTTLCELMGAGALGFVRVGRAPDASR